MKTNMGSVDRGLRIMLAVVIAALYYANVISGTLAIVLLVLAGIFMATSFAGFCPLYLPFGISTAGKSNPDFIELIKQGAQIIDVRSKKEYNAGHLEGSINIPLDEIRNHLSEITKARPVVVCCASGVRSGSAKNILQAHGYKVIDGGSWSALKTKLLGN